MAPKKMRAALKKSPEEWPKPNAKGRGLMGYPKYVAYCNYCLGEWQINDIDKKWDAFVADDDRDRNWHGKADRFRIEMDMPRRESDKHWLA